MIEYIKKPRKPEEILRVLNPVVKKWFFSKFKSFSLPQLYGVMEIHNKNNILISAQTGGTKTLTGFLSILNELVILSEQSLLENRVYCVYCSPLKALNRDIEENLKQPLKEMEEIAGKKFGIRVTVRTSDTSASEKQKMLKQVPHILVTTPESLAILLSSYKFIDNLKCVRYIIVDETHALAENKRGTHLSLSLERLQDLCKDEITRIGLSATIAPLDEMARFLVGSERSCKIADINLLKKCDLKLICPVPDLINTTQHELHNSLYNILDKLIQEHKTTLIFTNTRAGTERVVHHLKEKFPKRYIENIGAHHGSLSKSHRLSIEKRMRDGELKAIATSTSLELGIDIGCIDLVICIGSPKSIARLAQRIGRSGHRLQDIIKGRIIVLDRDDLVECSVMLKNVLERKIDKIYLPKNCLDVLAQHIHGIAVQGIHDIEETFNLIKKSYCYKNLSKKDFIDVIKYLAGYYATLEDRHVYAKIWYENGKFGRRGRLGRVIHMTNIGTIPDEAAVKVKVNDQTVGTIDEAFLEKLKRNDVFVLGGEPYEFKFSRGMVAQVKPSDGKLPTVPSWFSEMLPLSFDLALEISKFRRYLKDFFINKKNKEETLKFINNYLYVDKNSAEAIYNYFKEQYLYTEIPTDKNLLIEHYTDENKKYVVFHSLYGRRVNDALSRAVAYAISKLQQRDVEIGINDNGFFIASKKNIQVIRAFNMLKSEEFRNVMEWAIDKTEILKRRFRHCATRALMILRKYKGKKKRVGRQQVSSMILLNAVKRISKDFSILREAKREVLEDLMDVENAKFVLEQLQNRNIEVKQIHTKIPSPFAFNLITQSYRDILKMEERIEFVKRMHQMVLAKISLNKQL